MTMDQPFAEAVNQWEQWWTRRNTGPLPYIIHPQGDHAALRPYEKDWMPESVCARWDHWKPELMGAKALRLALDEKDDRYLDEWLDYMDAYAPLYGHEAAGYNFLCPGFGPACLSAFLCGQFRYVEPTVWLEPDQPLEYDRIVDLIDHPTAEAQAYRDLAFEILHRIADRLGDKYIISIPDFGEGMDVLSSLRHNTNLLTDLYDQPEAIHRALEHVARFADLMFDRAYRIIAGANAGVSACACVMRYLSARPMYLTYCDFCAMIGPEHFEQFVLPMIQRHAARFPDRTIYHLDGPGEFVHVPQICSVENVFGIQWVQGAGNPGAFDPAWDDLYRQILDSGKRIAISVPADGDLDSFFSKFPASEFTLNIMAPDKQAAVRMAERLDTWQN